MLAWAAWAGALTVVCLAFLNSPTAALLMLAAGGVWYWSVRRLQRFEIAAQEAIPQHPFPTLFPPLLEALPDAAILVERSGRIAAANMPARKLLSFEAKGQYLTAVLRHPDVLEAVEAALKAGARRAVSYQAPNQAVRHLQCLTAPVRWSDFSAALLVFHDETARISTERMRADFLANASHELRTPVASLSLLIETLSGHARDEPAERDRFLAMMQVQTDRMRQLIDDLLSLSRIELDEHVPPSGSADLVGVASEVASTLQGLAKEKQVDVFWSPPSRRMEVTGERFQLIQVGLNLVDNAIKYAGRGGQVRINVGIAADSESAARLGGRRWPEADRAALLRPATVTRRPSVFLRVEDNGPGIDARHLPRLGERFFRVARESGNERSGTGLGLAIVKHIVNRHGGGFVVESHPKRGSAFAVYFEESLAPSIHETVTKAP
jgi:two-component system phosphate regulon sensor histidine kinase PhoR